MDLSMYQNLNKVVYNDFNVLNSNLFSAVKHYDIFNEQLKYQEVQQKRDDQSVTHPKYKEMFQSYQSEVFNKDIVLDMDNPDYDAATKYIYVVTQVFSGSMPEKSGFIDLKGKYNSKFDSFRNKISFTNRGTKLKEHFDKLSNIENLDFEEVINKYDNKKAYFYLDPPYYNCEKYYSNHDFGLDTHERLANCLKKTKGRWALSYYHFDQLEEWFPRDEYRWVEKEFNKAAGAKKGAGQSKGTELLIMNYGK